MTDRDGKKEESHGERLEGEKKRKAVTGGAILRKQKKLLTGGGEGGWAGHFTERKSERKKML